MENKIKTKSVGFKVVMLLSVFLCSFMSSSAAAQSVKLHTLNIKSNKALHKTFQLQK